MSNRKDKMYNKALIYEQRLSRNEINPDYPGVYSKIWHVPQYLRNHVNYKTRLHRVE